MAGYVSFYDYSNLFKDESFLNWFWNGQNATNLISSLNSHNFKKLGLRADFLRREKHSPTIYGVVINYGVNPNSASIPVRSAEVTPLVQFFNEHNKHLCLMKVGFTNVSSDPRDDNRVEAVRKANEAIDQMSNILFSLPINFVDVTNPRDVEKKKRYELGVKLDKEIAKKLGLTEPTEWVITSTRLTKYVTNDILLVEKMKTGNDLRVLTVNVFSKHEQKFKELKIEVVSYLQQYCPFLLSCN